jgi:RHS repeat-associated protein
MALSGTPRYGTKNYWIAACTPLTGGGFGQGFIVKSPAGVTYKFDKRLVRSAGTFEVQRPQPLVVDQFPMDNVYFVPSEITDVHGNWVKYTYNSYGVTRIWGNDGRDINISYSGQTISSVTANGRTWNYSYTGGILTRVDLPDSRYWTFSDIYNYMNPGYCQAKRLNTSMGVIDMRHPSGVEAEFETGVTLNYVTNVPYQPFRSEVRSVLSGDGDTSCSRGSIFPREFGAKSLLKKTLDLGAGQTHVWTYDYHEPVSTWGQGCAVYSNGGCVSPAKYSYGVNITTLPDEKKRTVINPLGERTVYHINRSFYDKPGSIIRTERFATASSPTPLEVVRNETFVKFDAGSGTNAELKNVPWVNTGSYTLPTKTVTERDGDQYTTERAYKTDATASDYTYAKPHQVKTYSNVSTTPRTTDITYEHKFNHWMLGLTKTSTQGGLSLMNNSFTSLGQVSSVSQYGVTVATYNYNADGTVNWVRDALNRQVTLSNWKRGKPQTIGRPDGTTASQTFDDNGWLLTSTTPNNDTTAYSYDTMGRVTLINPPGSYFSSTSIAYSFPTSGPVQTITQGNRQTTVTHDTMYRPILTRMRDTTTTSGQSYVKMTYDALGRPVFTSFPSASSSPITGTTTSYDALGRMSGTSENVAPFATTSYAYLSSHRTAVTDPNGQVTTTWKDGYGGPGNGDVLKIQQPESVTTDMLRDALGKVTSVTQSGGGATTTRNYYYDTRQRLCRYVTPEAGHTVYAYDNANQMTSYARGYAAGTSCVTPTGNERVQLTYWPVGTLKDTLFTHAGTPDIYRTYDANGNLTQMYRGVSGDAVHWDYEYDEMDNLKREKLTTDGRIYDTTYVYNQLGDVTKTTLPGGFEINYTLDALGHDKTVQIGTSNLATNAVYHAGGFLSTMSYGNGHAYALTPDARLKPARIRAAKTGTVAFDQQYSYTPRGQISGVTDLADSGNTRSYAYDDLGRLETASGPWGVGSFTYDALGNLKTKARGSRSVINVYDAPSNRLIRSLDNLALASGGQGDRWIAYDGRGNMQQFGSTWLAYDKSYQMTSSAATATGTTASYKYDGHQKRVRIISSKPSAAMMSASGSGGSDAAFSADLDRLTSAARTSDTASRSSSSLSPSDVSDILASLLSTATEGRSALTSRGTAAKMVGSARPVYQDRSRGGFDAYKEVEARSEVDRSTEGLGSAASTSSAASPGCTGPTDTTIFNVYNAEGQLSLVDKAHLCKMTLYVRGAGMDLARIEVDTVAGTYTRTYLHADQLGSATAGTNQSGAVLWREQYAPYGDKLTAPAANDDLGSFTGHIDDDATTDMNLTYMQARYYDPGAGRFTSIDPVTFMDTMEPGMVNRYAYANNDPINLIDPSGESPCFLFDCDDIKQTVINAAESIGRGIDAAYKDPESFNEGLSKGIHNVAADTVNDLVTAAEIASPLVSVGQTPDVPRAKPAENQAEQFGITAGETAVHAITSLAAASKATTIYKTGQEFVVGAGAKPARIAPLGNRTGHPTGRYPHYHRRAIDVNGNTRPGGTLKRHRPWDKKSTDTSWKDRF